MNKQSKIIFLLGVLSLLLSLAPFSYSKIKPPLVSCESRVSELEGKLKALDHLVTDLSYQGKVHEKAILSNYDFTKAVNTQVENVNKKVDLTLNMIKIYHKDARK